MAVAAAEKATRGKGPVQVTFVDDKGKGDARRVPETVVAIRVTDAKGVAKDYPVNKISPAMKERFAAYGIASRVKMFVTHNIGDDGKVAALDLSTQLMGDFAEGKMYARAEGTGERRGKVYNPDIYVEASKLAHNEMFAKKIKNQAGQVVAAKEVTQDQLNKLKDKLLAYTPKERGAWQQKQRSNPFYQKHLKLLEAKKIDTSDADALF